MHPLCTVQTWRFTLACVISHAKNIKTGSIFLHMPVYQHILWLILWGFMMPSVHTQHKKNANADADAHH